MDLLLDIPIVVCYTEVCTMIPWRIVSRFGPAAQDPARWKARKSSKEGEKLENYTKYRLKSADELAPFLAGTDNIFVVACNKCFKEFESMSSGSFSRGLSSPAVA